MNYVEKSNGAMLLVKGSFESLMNKCINIDDKVIRKVEYLEKHGLKVKVFAKRFINCKDV